MLPAAQAHAVDWERWRGGGSLAVDARWARTADHAELEHVATAGVAARGGAGPGAFGLAVGLDYQLGASWPGGFAYDVNLLPLGLGAGGRRGRFMVLAGAGVSGVTRAMPFTVQLPVEAYGELALGSRLRLTAWGRVAWTLDDARGGAEHAPFGDEVSAGAALRFGKLRMRDYSSMAGGTGYSVGVTWAERDGARFLGATVGYSADAAWLGH